MLLLAIPAMSWVYTDFLQSMMELQLPQETRMMIKQNSLIYDSRNTMAAAAIQGGFDRIMWLDSDMAFKPDMIQRLNMDMDENGLDYVSALFFNRAEPLKPCVYKEVTWEIKDSHVNTSAEPVYDYPKDQLFECGGSGLGAVLMKTDLIRRVWEQYGAPFQPLIKLGEDVAFCWRAAHIGAKMYCDSRVKVEHIGIKRYGEGMYVPQI